MNTGDTETVMKHLRSVMEGMNRQMQGQVEQRRMWQAKRVTASRGIIASAAMIEALETYGITDLRHIWDLASPNDYGYKQQRATLKAALQTYGLDAIPDDAHQRDALLRKAKTDNEQCQLEHKEAYRNYIAVEYALQFQQSNAKTLVHAAILAPEDEVVFMQGAGMPSSARFSKDSPVAQAKDTLGIRIGTKWMDRALGGGMVNPARFVGTKGRGSYDPSSKTIKLRLFDTAGSMVHELGHHIEEVVPGVVDQAKALWKARTENEPFVLLKDLYPGCGYKPWEMTKVDKFFDSYCGKYYVKRGGSNELVSKGFELLYDQPLEFFNKDPEHFEHAVRWLSMGRQYNVQKWAADGPVRA
jgi:hypothetical protein